MVVIPLVKVPVAENAIRFAAVAVNPVVLVPHQVPSAMIARRTALYHAMVSVRIAQVLVHLHVQEHVLVNVLGDVQVDV